MFMKAIGLQVQSFFISWVSYFSVILLGVIVGYLLMFLPGVTEFLLIYTDIPLYSITAVIIVLIKIIKE